MTRIDRAGFEHGDYPQRIPNVRVCLCDVCCRKIAALADEKLDSERLVRLYSKDWELSCVGNAGRHEVCVRNERSSAMRIRPVDVVSSLLEIGFFFGCAVILIVGAVKFR